MIAGLILFLIGAGVGGTAVVINDRMVSLRVAELEKENRRLQEKIHKDRIEYERARFYRKGVYDARHKEEKKE